MSHFADPIAKGHQAYSRGEYLITTDPARLDVDAIHSYLCRSYWADMRPREIIEISLRHSLNFGLYHLGEEGTKQIGLARIVTDYAVFAYLCDVYVLEDHRGHGLGKWLVETIINDPHLQHVANIMLATRDAHGLYAQFGFTPISKPENRMERRRGF